MKIKEGFILRNFNEINVVLPLGENDQKFMIELNNEGVFLWRMFSDEVEYKDSIKKYQREFNINEDVAKQDIDEFITFLNGNHFLEESHE